MIKLNNLALLVASALVSSQALASDAPFSSLAKTPLPHAHEHGAKQDVTHIKPKAAINSNKLSAQHQFMVACNLNELATRDTTRLINTLSQMGTDCANEIFNAESSTHRAIYSSQKVYDVAKHATTLAKNYKGGEDKALESMFIYMRAAYYAAFYDNNIVMAQWVDQAIKETVDAFVANRYFYQNDINKASLLHEVFITIDSVELHHHYIDMMASWLKKFDNNFAAHSAQRDALAYILTLLYNGRLNERFVSQVSYNNELVHALKSFILQDYFLNTDYGYLLSDAAGELARLKGYAGGIESTVDSALSSLFNRYRVDGFGQAVWIRAAQGVSYYSDCNEYGICGWEEKVRRSVLSQEHQCGDNIKIKAQYLTNSQLTSACDVMSYEETLFHEVAATNYTPVANDYNEKLIVNVFNSYFDYNRYAGILFNGMLTNNGGMYLEGNPADPDNIPNFVAHEADYAPGNHFIWNFAHEYVHYLDARYNLHGDFHAPTENTIWWTEGFAEYIAKENYHSGAMEILKRGDRVALSDIFENDYQSSQERIYSWAYLAVRFMFERHQDEVDLMLVSTRKGDWTGYKARVNTWAARYNGEFASWLELVKSGVVEGRPEREDKKLNNPPTVNINGPYQALQHDLVRFSSAGSHDPDGYITSYAWTFGDGNTSTLENPQHTYVNPGSYTATLTVTDNQGATSNTQTSVEIFRLGNDDERPLDPYGTPIENNETVYIDAAVGDELVYVLDVPQGAKNLKVEMYNGQGDGDLYVKQGFAPTANDYDCRPYKEDSNESCEFSSPGQDFWYITAYAFEAFTSSLTVSYEEPSANTSPIEDACATRGPIHNGKSLDMNVAECLLIQGTTWLSLGQLSSYDSIAISSGNGDGDLRIDYSDSGWPSAQNTTQSSDNYGNQECIYIKNPANYWGYLKITGNASNATLVVDTNTQGCRN